MAEVVLLHCVIDAAPFIDAVAKAMNRDVTDVTTVEFKLFKDDAGELKAVLLPSKELLEALE